MRTFQYILGVSVSATLALSGSSTDSAGLNASNSEAIQPAPPIAQSQERETRDLLFSGPVPLAQTAPESIDSALQPSASLPEFMPVEAKATDLSDAPQPAPEQSAAPSSVPIASTPQPAPNAQSSEVTSETSAIALATPQSAPNAQSPEVTSETSAIALATPQSAPNAQSPEVTSETSAIALATPQSPDALYDETAEIAALSQLYANLKAPEPSGAATSSSQAQVPERLAQQSPDIDGSPEIPYLDPDPNPLLFPTRPEEVRLEGTQPLTLEQALELARRNNRELQVARLEFDRSRAVLRQALAAEYPTLTLQGDATRQQSPGGQISAAQSPTPRQGPNPDAPTNTLSGTLQLSYDLFTGGLRSANIRAAERQARVTELQVELLSEQLRLDVSEDYYNLQEALEQIRIRQQAVDNALRSLRDAQALEEAGVGTRFAVLQAQVQFANEQQRLTEAIAQLRTARRQLAQRLSIPQFIDLTAADPVRIAGRWELPLEQSIVLAFQNRAELEQQLVQRELNEAQRRAAAAARNPQVTLFANYNVLRTASEDELTVPGTGDGYTLGARVNWNLYDGGETRARVRQEEIDIAIAETNFADNRNRVRLQVEQSYFELVSTFENIQTASIALEQAREALRLARLRFQAGVGTQTEVIDAETELTLAEFNRIQAVLGYNRALARLQRSISNFPTFAVTTPP